MKSYLPMDNIPTPAPTPSSALIRPRSLNPFARTIYTFFGLTALVLRRLRYYTGPSILALVGVVLAVGLVTSAAFFAQAVDQVMMNRELAAYTKATRRPPFSSRIFTSSSRVVPLNVERAEALAGNVANTLSAEVGLPILESVMLLDSGALQLLPREGDTRYNPVGSPQKVNAVILPQVENYIQIVDGIPMTDPAQDGTLQVWMHGLLAEEMGIVAGEEFVLAASQSEARLTIQVAGLWRATDIQDTFWFNDPDTIMREKLLVRRDDYIRALQPILEIPVRTATWSVVLDESKALPSQARNYVTGFNRAEAVIQKYLPDARVTAPSLSLEKFVGRQTTLTTLLLGFNVPALGFLLYFLILSSAIIAYWQRRETAMLMSRGMTRASILNFTLIEGLILFIVGLPLGLLFGSLLARGMGYAVSFLTFSPRDPLPISWHGISLPLVLLTLGVVLTTKLFTAGQAAGSSVVTQEREQSRQVKGPFWYRNYIDLLIMIPAVYGYRQLMNRGSLGALVQDNPGDLYQDPLLILVPALFIVVAALLAMRLFPLLMWVLDRLAAWVPWLAPYMALRQLGRQSQSYINPLLLVIVALGLGVYTISMAGSLDQWLKDRVYYAVGADLTFEPFSENEASMTATLGSSRGAEWIPLPSQFTALPGVDTAARVGDYEAILRMTNQSGGSYRGRFLAVDRLDFAPTAWFRPDFAPVSMGELMNRLALTPEAILVSQDFLKDNFLQLGDTVQIQVLADFGTSLTSSFTVVGTYQYFPTVYPDQVTVIGNLDYINSFFGVTMPHNIWLRLQPGAQGEAILDQFSAAMGVDAIAVHDARAIVQEEQAEMERVGVFGTLSVSFLAAALMAALGLLTYSYASLSDRLYTFSVLRAIGLNRSEVASQVAMEYTVLTAYGAVAGVLIGSWAARIFVPLFRVSAELGSAPLPPLLPIIARDEIVPMAVLFAGTMIILETVLISTALLRRLFAALRLGYSV